jgi:hypothetical protein
MARSKQQGGTEGSCMVVREQARAEMSECGLGTYSVSVLVVFRGAGVLCRSEHYISGIGFPSPSSTRPKARGPQATARTFTEYCVRSAQDMWCRRQHGCVGTGLTPPPLMVPGYRAVIRTGCSFGGRRLFRLAALAALPWLPW